MVHGPTTTTLPMHPPPHHAHATPPLTAEGRRAPRSDVDTLALTGGHVGADGAANSFLVAFIDAGIIEAVIEVRRRVNGTVARGQRSPLLHQEATVLVPTVGTFLLLGATWRPFGAPRLATGAGGHLPRVPKVGLIRGQVPIGQSQVVVRVPVGVAAEAADGAGVGDGEEDPGVAAPIEGDGDAEVGGDEAMEAAEVGVELLGVLEGQLHQDAVDLEGQQGWLGQWDGLGGHQGAVQAGGDGVEVNTGGGQ